MKTKTKTSAITGAISLIWMLTAVVPLGLALISFGVAAIWWLSVLAVFSLVFRPWIRLDGRLNEVKLDGPFNHETRRITPARYFHNSMWVFAYTPACAWLCLGLALLALVDPKGPKGWTRRFGNSAYRITRYVKYGKSGFYTTTAYLMGVPAPAG